MTVKTPTENALVAQDGIRGLESVKARLAHYKKNEVVFEESINVLNLEVKLRDNALVENENMDVIIVVTPSNVKKVKSNHEFADVRNNGDAVEPKTARETVEK
ncbi:hypothetical protein Tco_0166117, partial [Tanacetum coccineum]